MKIIYNCTMKLVCFICESRMLLTRIAESSIIGEMMGKRKRNKQKTRRNGNVIIRRGDKTKVKVNKENSNVFGVQAKGQSGCAVVKPVSVKGTPVNPANRVTAPTAVRTVYTPPKTVKAPSFWETDLEMEMVKGCSVHGASVEVAISSVAKNKMTILMDKFKRIEWLAYLVGDKETHRVLDIVIPKQRVTSVNVYVDEPVDVPIIGVIHSHHDMGNNFSHTDDEYINANHDISLCVSHTGIKGHVRVKTECGRYFLADAKCIDIIDNFDTVEFLKDVDDKISEITHTYRSPGYNYGGGVHGGVARASNHVGGNIHSAHYPMDIDDEDAWDTAAVGSQYPISQMRELLECVRNYRESIKGIEVDDFYVVEFLMLVFYIRSIDSQHYLMWEEKAFDDKDCQYTTEYYALIDEISNLHDELTVSERQALMLLATDLEKRVEVSEVEVPEFGVSDNEVDEVKEEIAKELPKVNGQTLQ